ncbi:MAG: ABC transporter permease [Faecalibacterium sp.]|jgi:peptide/nickel transport system permease protein/oligopeptide transport system permease protein|nr:ABC transporter permease [Faecalibacterium sp.]
MGKYLLYFLKRVLRSLLTLFLVVTIVFCLLRLMPVEGYFANYEKMTDTQIQAGLQSMGLLDPLPVQIKNFWVNLLTQGDLGVSHIYKLNVPVTDILLKKLPISVELGVIAMLLALVIGLPMGLMMARYKNRWPDKLGTAIIVLIQAVPAAVYYLYIQMYGTAALNVGLLFNAENWRYWVLPVCSMSLFNIAFYAMWLRRYMVDESTKDYVRLARAKGVSENNIARKHVFRNAMVPLIQYIPSAFLNTVVGSIYIESLYSIPGMGGLLVTCVQKHDNTMVQGIVLLYACVGIIGLILGDILMLVIDPRISLGKKEGGR